jgi:hypothetical protein
VKVWRLDRTPEVRVACVGSVVDADDSSAATAVGFLAATDGSTYSLLVGRESGNVAMWHIGLESAHAAAGTGSARRPKQRLIPAICRKQPLPEAMCAGDTVASITCTPAGVATMRVAVTGHDGSVRIARVQTNE